jgi:hypothetical protein
MEAGAFFILVLALIVFAALGGGIYVIAMWLRDKQLDPEGDKVEGSGEKVEGSGEKADPPPRPEHVEHGKAQRAHFIGGGSPD